MSNEIEQEEEKVKVKFIPDYEKSKDEDHAEEDVKRAFPFMLD